VLAQSGAACASQPAAPHRVQVQGVSLPAAGEGALLLWGAMETMRVLPAAIGSPHRLQVAGPNGDRGSVQLRQHGGVLQGAWREPGDAQSPGCSYTEAVLLLDPVQEPARQAAQSAFADYLQRLEAAHQVLLAASRETARAPAEALAALAQSLPEATDADKTIAQVFIDGAQHAGGLRQRAAAAILLRAASSLYRRSAAAYPDDAALAFAVEARSLYRQGGIAAAQPLVTEALATLRQHGRATSSAASSVLGMCGSWQLRNGDVEAAMRSFAQAVRADEERGADGFDRAISFSNLAAALTAGGEPGQALQLLLRALPLAEASGENAAGLVETIREQISGLGGRNQGGVSA